MKIGQILRKKFSISFEFFPPKTEAGEKELFQQLKDMESICPDFVSVTYGAGGSTRDKTRRIVTGIANEEKWNVMAHLAGIGHKKDEIRSILKEYRLADIDNILALRGDTPAGTDLDPNKGELPHAFDLIRLIREEFDEFFSIGGAVFPERHVESPNWDWEMKYLKLKAEAGLDFGITQLFFDNRYFFEFIERCESYCISIPIIPGIMPITNFSQIQKFAAMCNATIPAKLTEKLEKVMDKQEEVVKYGVEFAVEQCRDLLDQGVSGLHFYTLNKSKATKQIYRHIQDVLDRNRIKEGFLCAEKTGKSGI